MAVTYLPDMGLHPLPLPLPYLLRLLVTWLVLHPQGLQKVLMLQCQRLLGTLWGRQVPIWRGEESLGRASKWL